MKLLGLVGMYVLGVATLATATVAFNFIEQTRCAQQYNVYTCKQVTAFFPVGAN